MPKSIYGYLVWFIVTLFVVYAFCLNTAAAVFSDAIKLSLHASDFGVSMASGAYILGFAAMQIPAGYLLDKFNARYIVSTGILLLILGNILISSSDNLFLFGLSNFLQGVGGSFAFIAAAVLISQWFPARQFPILFGLTQMLACVLAAVIHYSFTVALMSHSWNDIYRVVGALGCLLLMASILFIKSPAKYKHHKALSLIKSIKLVFTNQQIILCSCAAAFSFGTLLAYASFWYVKIEDYYAVDDLQSVMIGGLIFVGIGVGTPIMGWLANQFHSRKMIVHISLLLGTMVFLPVIYLPHYHLDTLIIIKLCSFLLGFLLSGSMLFYTMVSEISSDKTRGVAISLLNTAVFLFNTILLFLPYLFITVFSKDFFTYLWVLPFFVLVSILILYFIHDTHPEQ